jgi:hypothetical protein
MSNIINIKDINKKQHLQLTPEKGVAWAGLSSEEAARPGAGLVAMLYCKANEDGLNRLVRNPL